MGCAPGHGEMKQPPIFVIKGEGAQVEMGRIASAL